MLNFATREENVWRAIIVDVLKAYITIHNYGWFESTIIPLSGKYMRIQLCEFVFCVRVYGYVTVHMGLYVHVFALLGLITTIILIKDSRAERR